MNRFLEILYAILTLFANASAVILFGYMFFYGIQGWREIFNVAVHDLNARMFLFLLLTAIVAGMLFFLEKFINGIQDSITLLKGRPNEKKRTVRVR